MIHRHFRLLSPHHRRHTNTASRDCPRLPSKMVSGRRGLKSSGNDREYGPDDIESNRRGAVRSRFKDIVGKTVQDGRRDKLKAQLQEELKEMDLEHFRKSDDEVRLELAWGLLGFHLDMREANGVCLYSSKKSRTRKSASSTKPKINV